jgi:hypothetical protein
MIAPATDKKRAQVYSKLCQTGSALTLTAAFPFQTASVLLHKNDFFQQTLRTSNAAS